MPIVDRSKPYVARPTTKASTAWELRDKLRGIIAWREDALAQKKREYLIVEKMESDLNVCGIVEEIIVEGQVNDWLKRRLGFLEEQIANSVGEKGDDVGNRTEKGNEINLGLQAAERVFLGGK